MPKPLAQLTEADFPLVKWREDRGITQEQFLEKLRKVGVHITAPTLSRYENLQISRPTPSVVKGIAKVTAGAIGYGDLVAP
jgi:transcriptional regulator with XRE-family HTH domain